MTAPALEALAPLCRRLVGVVPSANTPFLADGRIDEAGVARLAERSVAAGVAGMLVLAVASENRALTLEERRRIGAIFGETVAGRIPLVVAVSAPELSAAIDLTKQAMAIGAPAICWQAPAGARFEELDDALARLAGLGPELLMLQDLDFAGPGLPLADIERLAARHPAFRAIKVETQGAGPKYSALLEAFGGAMHVSGGWAVTQLIEALQRGVHAFVPTALDHVYVRIHALFSTGRTEEARALFERLLPVVAFSNQALDVSIRTFKRIRLFDGTFATDHCRPPTAALDPYQQATLDALAPCALALEAECAAQRDDLTQR